jgi:hypothetical protein
MINKLACVTKKVTVLAVSTVALVSLSGCDYFLWLSADYAAMDARAAAACAQLRAPGSPEAIAANKAAGHATKHAADALKGDSPGILGVPGVVIDVGDAGEDADVARREAAKVPGCKLDDAILAYRKLDPSYNQDFFNIGKFVGPHT